MGDHKKMTVRVSSSIVNFKGKILKRYGWPEYRFLRDIFKLTIFWGCYHIGDYVRILLHRGERIIWWCGSDILNLKKNTFQYGGWFGMWRRLLRRLNARHFCENDVEKIELKSMGIDAQVRYIILDNPDQFNICFKQSKRPQVYLCAHPGYEETYGVNVVEGIASVVPDCDFHIYGVAGISHDNIKYHGVVSNERYNREARQYHAALRLNSMDGMSELLFKDLLMAHWPISMHIQYPYVTLANDVQQLIGALNDLKNKKEPNYKGREYWLNEAQKPLF